LKSKKPTTSAIGVKLKVSVPELEHAKQSETTKKFTTQIPDTRPHPFALPERDSKNFLSRMMYLDIY